MFVCVWKLKTETDRMRAEMEVVKILVESPKLQLVSALVCEYVVSLRFHYTLI